MPNATVKKVASVCGKSVEDVEKLWDRAEEIAAERGFAKGTNQYWQVTMGVFKRMIGTECRDKLGWELKRKVEMLVELVSMPVVIESKAYKVMYLMYVQPELAMNEDINKRFIAQYTHPEFIERHEIWDDKLAGFEPINMKSAYSKIDGGYIGDLKFAKYLTEEVGVSQIQKANPDHNVCSIGYVEDYKGKSGWAGWSHRALCIFGIGDKLFNTSEYAEMSPDTPFVKGGLKTIETLDEARLAAINFASYVG